jgi:hypothetical protein
MSALRPMTAWFTYACRNQACPDYRRRTGNQLTQRRPNCVRCGWALQLAQIITHNGGRRKR